MPAPGEPDAEILFFPGYDLPGIIFGLPESGIMKKQASRFAKDFYDNYPRMMIK